MEIFSLNLSPAAGFESVKEPALAGPATGFDAAITGVKAQAPPGPEPPSLLPIKATAGEEGATLEPNAPTQIPDFSPEAAKADALPHLEPKAEVSSRPWKTKVKESFDDGEAPLHLLACCGPIRVDEQRSLMALIDIDVETYGQTSAADTVGPDCPGIDVCPTAPDVPLAEIKHAESASAQAAARGDKAPASDSAPVLQHAAASAEADTVPNLKAPRETQPKPLEDLTLSRPELKSEASTDGPLPDPTLQRPIRSTAEPKPAERVTADIVGGATADEAPIARSPEPKPVQPVPPAETKQPKPEVDPTLARPRPDQKIDPTLSRKHHGHTPSSGRTDWKKESAFDASPKEIVGKAEVSFTPKPAEQVPQTPASPVIQTPAADLNPKLELSPKQTDSVIAQVVDRLEVLAAKSPHRKVTIHLDPRDFGSITLVVRGSGSEVDAEVYASNESVRTALENGQKSLHLGLEQRGIQLGSMTIGSELPHGSGRQEQAMREMASEARHFMPQGSRHAAPTLSLEAMHAARRSAAGMDLWI